MARPARREVRAVPPHALALRNARLKTQRIRDWMTTYPDEAARVRAANRSYVFFRITGLSNEGEPIGATPQPSLRPRDKPGDTG